MDRQRTALNGICPYFTMFPLDFPLGILRERAQPGDYVLDPFCGRGTTNFAARLLGIPSLGVDASPVAAAITAAKLVAASADDILAEAQAILDTVLATDTPSGEFWQWAFHPDVLEDLCRFRTALLTDCTSPARVALRGVILGALHGPRQKAFASYFSNQSPRTYAPKPAYATRYWARHGLIPERVDSLAVLQRRAIRYYTDHPHVDAHVRHADSRLATSLQPTRSTPFTWVITSPPYYGMNTYIPDQWLRHWFLGGPATVDYTTDRQVRHSSPDDFAAELRTVWHNAAHVAANDAMLVIRFGGLSDRRADPQHIITNSLENSGWTVVSIAPAGTAHIGKRQADTFLRRRSTPVAEFDVWASNNKHIGRR